MFRPNVFAYAVVVSFCCIILSGCAGNIVYRFDPPDQYQAIPIKGLPEEAKVIEMVDRLTGDCAQQDSLVLIVKETKQLAVYNVSVSSGEATFLSVATEPPTKSFYWEKFSQTGKTAGDVASGCFSSGCFALVGGRMSHVSERWGFEGERRFACDSDDRVLTSVQYVEKKEYAGAGIGTTIEYTYADAGVVLKYVINDEVVEISQASGYFQVSNKENTRKIRYYLMSDGNVLGCAPDEKGSVGLTNVIVYDLQKKASWGTEMLMPGKHLYNDFAVTSDGALAVMLVGKPGSYQLLEYEAIALGKATKLFRTTR